MGYNNIRHRKRVAVNTALVDSREIDKPLLESAIQRQIMDYLGRAGLQASVTNADRTWGKGGGVRASKVPKGHPDITAVLPVVYNGFVIGLAWYIEVKTPTGSTSSEQKDKLTALAQAGALCTLARDVDTVIRVVTDVKNKPWSILDKKRYDEILALNLFSRRTKAVRERCEILSSSHTAHNHEHPENG